ncbi:unnamed protein product [Rodentolepis nana]|uniref:BTB domain-containing protein n=1 Tax=Rodentolepis nana TaxID=102285 RepID=A0A0R3TL62_RODNA|nr:unnamed protein product [Rodentolepis nana]
MSRKVPTKLSWNFNKANWPRFTNLLDNELRTSPLNFNQHLDKLCNEITDIMIRWAKKPFPLARLNTIECFGLNTFEERNTAAEFVDLKSAYDLIWKEKLILKLAKIGVPQGAVTSCTLFNVDRELSQAALFSMSSSIVQTVTGIKCLLYAAVLWYSTPKKNAQESYGIPPLRKTLRRTNCEINAQERTESALNCKLKLLANWCDNNGITYATSKLTKGGTAIPAHKLVLCAKFQTIKNNILMNKHVNLSNWSRFSNDIVMAVVDFAYTDEIIINVENVLGIYLLAHILGCQKLIDWSTDFIKTRWRKLPPVPTLRYATGAAHIPGVGDIVVGGYARTAHGDRCVNIAKILLTTSSSLGHAGSWCEITRMLHSRVSPSAEFFSGKVYVASGTTSVEMVPLFPEDLLSGLK